MSTNVCPRPYFVNAHRTEDNQIRVILLAKLDEGAQVTHIIEGDNLPLMMMQMLDETGIAEHDIAIELKHNEFDIPDCISIAEALDATLLQEIEA